MEARKLKRPNVGECQKLYDKYGINDSNHTGTTTDLCAVIQELEQRLGAGQVDALVMPHKKLTKDEMFRKKQEEMPDAELAELAREEISKLCKTGGKSLTMTVPPRVEDTDMLLCELIRRFKKLSGVA